MERLALPSAISVVSPRITPKLIKLGGKSAKVDGEGMKEKSVDLSSDPFMPVMIFKSAFFLACLKMLGSNRWT